MLSGKTVKLLSQRCDQFYSFMSRSSQWNELSVVYKRVRVNKGSLSGHTVIFLAENCQFFFYFLLFFFKTKLSSYSLFVSFVHRKAKKIKE